MDRNSSAEPDPCKARPMERTAQAEPPNLRLLQTDLLSLGSLDLTTADAAVRLGTGIDCYARAYARDAVRRKDIREIASRFVPPMLVRLQADSGV